MLKKNARIVSLRGEILNKKFKGQLDIIKLHPNPDKERAWTIKLMLGRKIRRKLPGKIILESERRDPIQERDETRKKQMKAYADERRHNIQCSSIRIGDRVLLKQSKYNMSTPAYDP